MAKLERTLAVICALALLNGSAASLVPAFAESEAAEEKPAATPKSEAKSEEKSETKSEEKSEAKSEEKSEAKSEEKNETKSEEKNETKTEEKAETKTEEKTEAPETTAEKTNPPETTTEATAKPADTDSDATHTPEASESEKPADPSATESETAAPTPSSDPDATVDPDATTDPDSTAMPGITIEPEAPGESVEPSATPKLEPLKAIVASENKFGVIDSKPINYQLAVTGGLAPYSVKISITRAKEEVFSSSTMVNVVSYLPTRTGDYTLTFTVTDALGEVSVSRCTVPASTDKKESLATWVAKIPARKKGETMAQYLVDVARSQVGYKENEFNFVIDDEGKKQGYTIYGHWYGLSYEEWCGMFASFCLYHAGISSSDVPREANCYRWMNALWTKYIDDEDNYLPRPGDLIFFHHDRVSTDPNFPNHVGIVVDVDRENRKIRTVEGNSGKAVRECEYDMDNERIVGYVNVAAQTAHVDIEHALKEVATTLEDIPQLKRLARTGAAAR